MKELDFLLFGNTGSKIKSVAKIFVCVCFVINFLVGTILFVTSLIAFQKLWFLLIVAPVYIILSCLISWFIGLLVYGYGEIVQQNCNDEKDIGNEGESSKPFYDIFLKKEQTVPIEESPTEEKSNNTRKKVGLPI